MGKDLLNVGKIKVENFTRRRKLPFEQLIVLIINLMKKSLQLELNKFKGIINEPLVSKQAFSKARKNLNPIVFKILNNELIKEFYTDNDINKFKGYRVLAVDSSTVRLPRNQNNLNYFGHMFASVKKQPLPMARTSVLFDLLNKITLDATISPIKESEHNLVLLNLKKLKKIRKKTDNINDIILFDRGYPSTQLIVYLFKYNLNFVMRCNKQFIKETNLAYKNGVIDEPLELCLSNKNSIIKNRLKLMFPFLNLDKKIKLRVVVFDLISGEKEILLTNLLNINEFTRENIFNLYSMRWGIEENYKLYKKICNLENFSGEYPIMIKQDFYATVFACNIAGIAMNEALNELNQEIKSKNCKYKYTINRQISIGTIKNEIISVLLNDIDLQEYCITLRKTLKKSLIPIRPGRSNERFILDKKDILKTSRNVL